MWMLAQGCSCLVPSPQYPWHVSLGQHEASAWTGLCMPHDHRVLGLLCQGRHATAGGRLAPCAAPRCLMHSSWSPTLSLSIPVRMGRRPRWQQQQQLPMSELGSGAGAQPSPSGPAFFVPAGAGPHKPQAPPWRAAAAPAARLIPPAGVHEAAVGHFQTASAAPVLPGVVQSSSLYCSLAPASSVVTGNEQTHAMCSQDRRLGCALMLCGCCARSHMA